MTSGARLLYLLGLLWFVGMSTRITVLAVPPVIPLIREDLRMTETEVGLLIGLPVLTWALAAIPGSLLIARLGATFTLAVGLALTGLAAAGRGAAPDVWALYLATMLMGCGIAIMQPALPTLVRDWVPHRIGLGTAVSSNGMTVGVAAAPALTIPFVLPMIGQDWRLALLWWAVPVLAVALIFPLLAPRRTEPAPADVSVPRRWWPDWKNPLIWLLGLTFGCNNALYYGTNAFLPDYLASTGHADLTGAALGFMNGSQFVASLLLLITAERLQRRAWPYLVFGPTTLLGSHRHRFWFRRMGRGRGRSRRVLARSHVCRDARTSAGAESARRRSSDVGRDVHGELHLRGDRPRHLRRPMGSDRSAVDSVCAPAVVPDPADRSRPHAQPASFGKAARSGY